MLQLHLEYHALQYSEFLNSACICTLTGCKIYTPFREQTGKNGYISLRIVRITVGYSEYLSRIELSDECIFRLNSHDNNQNVRSLGNEHPFERNQVFMQCPKFIVWCAATREKVVSPYFFKACNVDGEKYRNMLTHYAFPRFATFR